jgi:hypothetical protein
MNDFTEINKLIVGAIAELKLEGVDEREAEK